KLQLPTLDDPVPIGIAPAIT
nr:RecName: Full=Unknown protein NF007 from 2D-PAGE [Naegleria fowleri]